MSEVTSYAKALTQRGYACYPVSVRLDSRGEKQFSFPGPWGSGEYPIDPDGIEGLFEGHNGLVINTERSGIVVLDIDTKHGHDGFAALAASGVELPNTPVKARTPSGGEHWFYRAGSVPVECSQSKIADGVDIRARGGIVVGPPTEVPGYGQYEFIDPSAMVPVSELPVFPDAVAESLKAQPSAVPISTERPILTVEQRQRLELRMDRILRDLATMEDGARNTTMRRRMIRLFGIGMTLGEDPYVVAELAREAYFESGGSAEKELESFIEWAMAKAQYELPDEETDEAFEAEVAARIRRARIEEEAKARMSPVRATRVSDEDVLEFDPDLGDGDWLINDLLPRSETVILFGPPAAAKTFAAVDLAQGVATGTQAWGREVKQGSVLYLAGEGTRRLMVRRKAWEVYHETSSAEVQYRKMRLLLASDESVAEHQELVARLRPALIVVDTMLRASEGLILENPGEAARVIAQLDRVREASPGATLVVLHHPPESNPDKPSGSYPLRGNVDTIFKLVNDDGVRTLSAIKTKESDDTSWRRTFELRGVRIPGTQLSSAVFVPS